MSKLAVGCTSKRDAIASLCRNFSSMVGKRDITEPISIVRQEHFLALQVGLYRLQSLTNRGIGSGLHEGDRPVVDIAVHEFEFSSHPATRQSRWKRTRRSAGNSL